MKLIKTLALTAAFSAAMTSSAVTNVVFGGREWRLSPECSLEGSLLTVTVPKGSERGMHAAITKVDLSPFEAKAFESTIRVCGNEVSTPPQSYNGVKFMFGEMPVTRAVMKLPPDLREVLLMHELQGLKLREIARARRLPLATVSSRLKRAKDRLRRDLEGWYFDEE
jgi:hypothetical protein